jgi:hypothetical protein
MASRVVARQCIITVVLMCDFADVRVPRIHTRKEKYEIIVTIEGMKSVNPSDGYYIVIVIIKTVG